MVRLRDLWSMGFSLIVACFNSNMVRLRGELALVQASDLDRAKEELDRFCFNARDCEIESVKKSAIVGLLNVSFDE
ncbi:hypothetical protein HQ38_05795 [Porphyromonas crevioricanis]|nr:hypothetical protein HQ38_05795 [Porphyromonas crevioricanis]